MLPPKLTCVLVGAFHRPPAKQVIDVLPLEFELYLQPEPDNQFDPNAIMVIADLSNLPVDKIPLLDAILPEPFDASELCAAGLMQLGYIPRSGGKPAKGLPGNWEVLDLAAQVGWDNLVATLGTMPEGYSVVNIGVK